MYIDGQLKVASFELLSGDPALVPTGRVYYHTSNNIVKVYSGSAWLTLANNPMTTAGDTMYATGANGATARLAIGAAYSIYRTNAGATAPEWSLLTNDMVAASGTANIARNKLATGTANAIVTNDGSGYMTNLAHSGAQGGILRTSSTTAYSWLAIGAANYVLRSDGTDPSWGLIVNANVDASAAIAYSKLNLSGSILNADVSASAAIAYSKLNLSGSILNADVSASAAIAYSKLNLTSSIVNADISASAAIVDTKLATISTAGKVSGSAITSGTIDGTTAWSTSGAIAATGAVTMQNNVSIVGSDSGATTITNNTNKIHRKVVKQYATANTDWVGVGFVSTSTYNAVEIGGGTSAYNCATQIDFITAANQTTVTGTNRGGISSTGAWTIGPSAAGPTITATIRGSANNGQLLQLTTPSGHTSGASSVGILDINTSTIVSNVSASYAFRVQTQIGECFSINNAGLVVIGTGTSTTHRLNTVFGTTVGAAGGASALPATPTGYITININGTDRKMPYYAT